MKISAHLLLGAAFCLSLPVWAGESSPPSYSKQLEPLVQESLRSKPPCEDYKKSVNALLAGQAPGLPLKDRAAAMKLLALARGYPGTPAATREVFSKVAEAHHEGKLDDELVKTEMGAYGCELLSVFDTLRTLILSASPLHFTAKERAQLAAIVYDRIVKDAGPYTTMIEVTIYGELLTMLVDERIVPVSDAIFVETLRWNEQMNEARAKLREAYTRSSNPIGLELDLMRPLGQTLVRVARRLSLQS